MFQTSQGFQLHGKLIYLLGKEDKYRNDTLKEGGIKKLPRLIS